jgi:hypothetical protein
MAAVLWPSRFLGPLDGAPLDRPAEAILLGLVLPWLFWLGREASRRRVFRLTVVVLLAWKVATFAGVTQQGLCATVRASQPLSGEAFRMRIDEPRGFLRSWDVRADLWADEPRCTAILTRSMHRGIEFPAWFVNITAQMIPQQSVAMTVNGVVSTTSGMQAVTWTQALAPDGDWKFDPLVNGASVWISPLVTITAPTALDRAFASWAWVVSPALCGILLLVSLNAAARPLFASRWLVAWIVLASLASIGLAASPLPPVQRLIGLLLLAAAAVPVAAAQRRLATVAWMIGAPWLTFFAALSVATVGRLTPYSFDDWLAYQIAGYRIYFNGRWIEGGSAAFDYQALYRWITGALHLVFGDSSIGEIYWDASCLLAGALVAYQLTRSRASFTWGLVAAALTLATTTVATPWYIIGRGLPDISAAAFAFVAMACLMRARHDRLTWAWLAAAAAGAAFYARQNHLLWMPCLVFLLLPEDAGADWRSLGAALPRLRWRPAAAYLAGYSLALIAFMTRTWYFTGVLSLFYGTSLNINDTGLRPWHLLDGAVWAKVGHSLAGLLFMNEPPHFDARSAVVVIGVIVGLLAMLQLAFSRDVPAGIVMAAAGSVLAAFLVHSHAYPGRFTVHLIPLASAITAIASAALYRRSGAVDRAAVEAPA